MGFYLYRESLKVNAKIFPTRKEFRRKLFQLIRVPSSFHGTFWLLITAYCVSVWFLRFLLGNDISFGNFTVWTIQWKLQVAKIWAMLESMVLLHLFYLHTLLGMRQMNIYQLTSNRQSLDTQHILMSFLLLFPLSRIHNRKCNVCEF